MHYLFPLQLKERFRLSSAINIFDFILFSLGRVYLVHNSGNNTLTHRTADGPAAHDSIYGGYCYGT